MKVSLSGLSQYSDMLHIDLPKRVGWQDITGLLNVDGAKYYLVNGCTILVSYSKAADVPDFAAQCLRVVMQHFDIGIEELAIGIHDYQFNSDTWPGLANDIWSRTVSMSTPEPVSPGLVEARGSGPAYWLH